MLEDEHDFTSSHSSIRRPGLRNECTFSLVLYISRSDSLTISNHTIVTLQYISQIYAYGC